MLLSLVTFALAAALVILLPGPDTMVVVRSIVRGGRSAGTATAAGILVGLVIWVCVAALGLATLLRASHLAYDVLRVVGGMYLVWLGIQSLRAMRRGAATAPSGRPLTGNGFAAGLISNLVNPKVGVFFVTFLPGFVPHGYPVGLVSLLLGAVFVLLSVGYYVALVGLASTVTGWLASSRIRRRMDAVTGTVLLAFGLRLAVEG